MKHSVIALLSVAMCLLAGLAFAGPLDDGVQLTKAKRGAYVGFTVKWGGDRPPQKYLVMRSFLPTPGGSPVTALTGTIIPFNAVGDLNPLGWSRRNQVLALLGLGATIWVIENNSHGHSGNHAALVVDDDENEDDEGDDSDDSDDSDSYFPRHCFDGHGKDGFFNKHCE